MDMDIFIRSEPTNAGRTRKALETFGYDMTNVSVQDLLAKKVLIRQYAVETDIHPFAKGVTFDELWRKKVRVKFGDTFVYVASLDDLIAMKQAAGRPKDVEDLKYLKKLKMP